MKTERNGRMTDEEYEAFCLELKEECGEHFNIENLIDEVKQRDVKLALLIEEAEKAEEAIAIYLREKDAN